MFKSALAEETLNYFHCGRVIVVVRVEGDRTRGRRMNTPRTIAFNRYTPRSWFPVPVKSGVFARRLWSGVVGFA